MLTILVNFQAAEAYTNGDEARATELMELVWFWSLPLFRIFFFLISVFYTLSTEKKRWFNKIKTMHVWNTNSFQIIEPNPLSIQLENLLE